MISKYALVLANHFAEKDMYSKEKINVYKYGFELLISTVLNISGILLISIVLGVIEGAVLFCMAFIPLRLAAGGYHAKHHWSCILGFNVIFFGIIMLHRYMNIKYALPYSLAAIAVSALLVWSLAPVEAFNKPLKDVQRERQRKKSVLISSINLALVLLFFVVPSIAKYAPFLAIYSSGTLAASLLLVVAQLVDRQERTHTDTTSE
ncbi:MAG: accessory gene regulator B family protein [Anaerotignum sp.]|nr:accessory gene regulator B family protein [Anaerotignum sp.]